MIYIFLFLIFFIGIIAIIISSIITKTNKEGVPFVVGKKFIKEFNPKIGEDVNFWHNERDDTINIYLKGTIGGSGKIGTVNSKPDLKKLNDDLLFAKIHNIAIDTIFLKYYN